MTASTGTGPRVVVMGVAGCGKSTVGRALAEALRLPFCDADDLHPAGNLARLRAGIPLTDADRAPWLDAVADWLAARPAGGVVACSALRRGYRDRLRRAAPALVCCHLAGPEAIARERVAHRRGHVMPASLVVDQYATLEPLQPDERGVLVDFSRPTPEVVRACLDAVLGRPPLSPGA